MTVGEKAAKELRASGFTMSDYGEGLVSEVIDRAVRDVLGDASTLLQAVFLARQMPEAMGLARETIQAVIAERLKSAG